MSINAPPTLPRAPVRRSLLVTLLAWTIIVISALLCVISFISLLMILSGNDGAASVNAIGFLSVVVAPPATLAGGIGLLLRRAWARYYVIALMCLLIALNVWQLIATNPETTTYTSSTGVKTTVVTSYSSDLYRVPVIVICTLALAVLFKPSVRDEFRPSLRSTIPAPAQIPPDDALRISNRSHGNAKVLPRATPRQKTALILVIAIFLGIALGMAWLVFSGIGSGETYFPSKRPSQQRTVVRQSEPATFWICTGVYSAVGLGSAAMALWCMRQAARRDL